MAASSRWHEDVYFGDDDERLTDLSSELIYPSSDGVKSYQGTWWHLYYGISVGNFRSQGSYQDGPSMYLTGLFLGIVVKDFPLGESPKLTNTFLNDFLMFKGLYPVNIFCTSGWVYSMDRMWWSRVVIFVLANFKAIL